jgi:hypothetical protein
LDRKRIAALVALVGWASGCQDTPSIEPNYDGPAGAAVLHPEDGGPFNEPVGFITNARSGRIHALDLKHGWLLADDPAAPYLWGAPLATGADRILGDVAAWAPSTDRITLFAADAAFEVLVEVPYVVGVDDSGAPIEPTPVLRDAAFFDVDSSGDGAELLNLELSNAKAATETWLLEYDGSEWIVTGSRSGLQANTARFLTPYASDERALTFTISGTATAGDQISLSVDTGAVEHDLGGVIQALELAREVGLLLASVYDRETDETALVAFDPEAGAVRGAIPLPEGAIPWRMSATPDGGRVYVADARSPAVYEVLLDAADPSASAVRAIETAGPVADVAWEGDDTYDHLFLGIAGENRVDIYDLLTDSWRDVNPYTPEIDGIQLDSPVTGMISTHVSTPLPETGVWGGHLEDEVVAIATFNGELLMAEASTGCLVRDEVGPYSFLDAEDPFIDKGATSNPYLQFSEADDQYIQVNPCAGIAREEGWRATFSESLSGWVLDGERSGIQENIAYEDQRYVSDNGGLSLLILAGVSPTTDGDELRWEVVDGIARVDGDLDGNGQIDDTLDIPARPAAYSYLAGATGGGWDAVNRKVGVLWPITNSDEVLRVSVESAAIENIWD